MFKDIFKFRDKNELIGTVLGCLCFTPTAIACFAFLPVKPVLGGAVLVTSQILWLESIRLCTYSVQKENIQLKEKLKILKSN